MTFEQAFAKGVLNLLEQERRELIHAMKTGLKFGLIFSVTRAVPDLISLTLAIRRYRAYLKRLTSSLGNSAV